MSKTDAVMKAAFYPGRPPRSAAYRAGVRNTLLKRLDGFKDIPFPYQLGSAEADAYLSGTEEGIRRAKEVLEEQRPPVALDGSRRRVSDCWAKS